jgi:hypothetical protein
VAVQDAVKIEELEELVKIEDVRDYESSKGKKRIKSFFLICLKVYSILFNVYYPFCPYIRTERLLYIWVYSLCGE